MGVKNTDIVNSAMTYIGKLTYSFGGNNISGGSGDCSDFTQHIFSLYGLEIGGYTEMQYSQGFPVKREEIKSGDLVFFKNTYNSGYKDGVSHVGIAVSNENFIHLSNSGCQVSSLNDSYWKEHYLDSRRINGVDYSGESSDILYDVTDTYAPTTSDINLVWWGDIVKVTTIIIVFIMGVVLLGLSVSTPLTKGVNLWQRTQNT